MRLAMLVLLCLALPFVHAASYKLDLSGGSGGTSGTKVYTAPNGTVVTSSANVYSNSSYYYMGYMFNSTYGTTATHYWLTNSSGNQTLTFAFNQSYYFDFIRVYPTTISDRKSNYQIEVSTNGINYSNLTGGFVTTTSDPVGTYRDHSALNAYSHVRFTLTRQQSWGVTLNEVEFYVSTQPAISVNNINFGNVRVGTTASSAITVTNTGVSGSTLTGNINAASGDFSPATGSQSFTLGSSQSASRTFQYTPSSRGSDSTNVSITSNISNVNSTLSGTGVSPVFSSSLSPNTNIDFGTVEYSNSQSLQIQNLTPDTDLGNLTNLTLLSATITGPDASFFSLSGFTPGMVLSKNALANLAVVFQNYNHGMGMKNAVLTIVTDQNAAFGQAGDTFTWNLSAQAIPEPGNFWLMGMVIFLVYGISRFSRLA